MDGWIVIDRNGFMLLVTKVGITLRGRPSSGAD